MRERKPAQVYTELEITAMASDGWGIARSEGMVVFVEHAVTGDVVDVRVTRKKSGFRQGVPIHFYKRSELRIDPVCSHFGVCGGCKWQVLSYDQQLALKSQTVFDALQRIGKIEFPLPAPILGAPAAYAYRNKLEYTFSDTGWLTNEEIESGVEYADRNAFGFHIPGRFDKVLDIKTCYLQDELGNQVRLFVRAEALKRDIQFFNLVHQTGVLRTMLIRNNQAGEWMVCLTVTQYDDAVESLLTAVKHEFPQIKSLYYVVNTKRNDTISDQNPIVFSGEAWIDEEMEGLKFRIHPKSFYQTNAAQAYELYKITREYADIQPNDIVYDLYTGTGTIALFVAKLAKKVVGVEYVQEAVADALENMAYNKVENTSFYAGDMKDVLVDEFFQTHGAPDVIITDPPRAGMHESVVNRIKESGARTVVYVSCNPSTQARDLALLDSVYRVEAVQPVDMFPQTTHVENVVKLVRRS